MPQKEHIRRMFDSIASDYDRLNHLMSLDVDRSWRRKALRAIVEPGVCQHILDVACGTGDFSMAIARALQKKGHPDSRVVGVDLSEGMLEIMRTKVAAAGLTDRISVLAGDGEALAFRDGAFDAVTIAFGIRNFEDREKGLREMVRVLRPGGRLVILELSQPSGRFLRWAYGLYFKHILPRIGGAVSGDKPAYAYLPASVIAFPGKEAFMATLSACGLESVTHRAFSFGICRMYTGRKP